MPGLKEHEENRLGCSLCLKASPEKRRNYVSQENQAGSQEEKVDEATADFLDQSEEPSDYKDGDD